MVLTNASGIAGAAPAPSCLPPTAPARNRMTKVPLSARSLGPPGMASAATTQQFVSAVNDAQRTGFMPAAAPWAGPSSPRPDTAAGRESSRRDRTGVATSEAKTLADGDCTVHAAPGTGAWTGDVVRRVPVDGSGRPGTAEGKPAGRNHDDAVCLTQDVGRKNLPGHFSDAAGGEMDQVLSAPADAGKVPAPRSAGYVRSAGGARYPATDVVPDEIFAEVSAADDGAKASDRGYSRRDDGKPFSTAQNFAPLRPDVLPKGPPAVPARLANSKPYHGFQKFPPDGFVDQNLKGHPILGGQWLGEEAAGRQSRPRTADLADSGQFDRPDKPTTNGWWSSRPGFPSGGQWIAAGVGESVQANLESAAATRQAVQARNERTGSVVIC